MLKLLELIVVGFAVIINFIASIIIFIDVIKKEVDKIWLIPSFLFFGSAICWVIVLIIKIMNF